MSVSYTVLPSGRLRYCLSPALPEGGGAGIFLTAAQAADLLNISKVSLARWRIKGSGPPFSKFGRAVRYERSTLFDWARSRARGSTSE
jgi:Helix-turn-helix domain